jgi:hypothetical protein
MAFVVAASTHCVDSHVVVATAATAASTIHQWIDLIGAPPHRGPHW